MPTATDAVTDVTCLVDELVKTRQALEYTNIITCATYRGNLGSYERFRVRIKRDTYEFQSFARVDVWRQDGWTTVHSVHGEDARVADLPTYVCRDLKGAQEQFGDLATELLTLAGRIVA